MGNREKHDRALLIGAGLLALVALACPKPAPPVPVGPPDAADAARPPAPKKVSCSTACKHAEAVCMGSHDVCLAGCNRVSANDPGFAPCVVAVPAGPNACPALSACDALARASR